MTQKYTGYGVNCLTMKKNADSQCAVGDLVKLNSDGEVEKALTNDFFIGVITYVRGDYVTVQTQGYAEFYVDDATSLTYGPACLAAKEGGVKTVTPSSNPNYVRTIIYINEIDKKIGIIL